MESWGKAVHEEIGEPERIVYVDSFCDPEGVGQTWDRLEERLRLRVRG